MVRLPHTSYVRVCMVVALAGFCILLFARVDGSKIGVQNRSGSMFFITMTIVLWSVQNVVLIFPDERAVFLREANNNMYCVTAYFFAKVFAELPSSVLTPILHGCITYFAIGYNTDEAYKFPVFLLIMFLMYNSAAAYALVIGATFSDKHVAVTLTPVIIVPFMLFSGFFVNSNNIPYWLKEFEYLSIFKYGY